jgi:hypothetical protein
LKEKKAYVATFLEKSGKVSLVHQHYLLPGKRGLPLSGRERSHIMQDLG